MTSFGEVSLQKCSCAIIVHSDVQPNYSPSTLELCDMTIYISRSENRWMNRWMDGSDKQPHNTKLTVQNEI